MTELVQPPASVATIGSNMKRKLPTIVWVGGAVLSAGIAFFSYRYLAKIGPVPPTVANNRFVNPWIIVHAASAATALLVGPVQFLPRVRRRWPKIHRWTGRTYVIGCFAGGVSALVLAAGISSGVVAGAGFATLGIAWIYVTAQGWRTARAHRFSEHPRWMIRSFALTFSAVTLRIYMLAVGLSGLDMRGAYPLIAWLCWVPNAIFAELYLRRDGAHPAVAGTGRTSS